MAQIVSERTHHCNQLRSQDEGATVTLMGWIHRRRDHGGIVFLDLRDREGITQVTVSTELANSLESGALRLGSCIGVDGRVARRESTGGSTNKNIPTGEIEVLVDTLQVFNVTEPLPFTIDEETDAAELTRLRYRYLDIRRGPVLRNLILRSKIAQAARQHLDAEGYTEVETPILMRSTPEGARDYLVPSRLEPGHFYALPQSPQIYKQLLMCAGLEKYFQIARCFRDEDLRADRQPEFTQIDIEMSFGNTDKVFALIEGMFQRIFSQAMDMEIEASFPRMSYREVMEKYGEDKPDLRYGLELLNFSSLFEQSEFKAFAGAVGAGGAVKGIRVPGEAGRSRKWLSNLESLAKDRGAKGMAWMKVEADGLRSPIAKFLNEEELAGLQSRSESQEGDLLLLVADSALNVVNNALSTVRRHLAQELNLIDKNQYSFLWIEDFPLVEYDAENDRYEMLHHAFTLPHHEDMDKLITAPAEVRALSYDLVLNGFELGSGSMRIYDPEIQRKVLSLVEVDEAEADRRFGFLLEALKYGAPPHGGIALGLDRIAMILTGSDSLREVIAFPKTTSASDPMSRAPSTVDEQQLADIHIQIRDSKKHGDTPST